VATNFNTKTTEYFCFFLALGGDSIKAIMLLNQLQQQLDIELSLADILTHATIADFALFLQNKYPDSQKKLQELDKSQTNCLLIPVLERPQLTDNTTWSCVMSFAQQQLWLLLQLQENNTAYNLPITLTIRAPLDISILEKSLILLVQRHEILRTCFAVDSNQPLQIIHADLAVTLPYLDLRHYATTEQWQQIKNIVKSLTEKTFNLAEVPLWRWQLLQLTDDHYLLHLVLHHLISDGWSIYLLQSELSDIYHALLQQQTISLPTLTLQYADFSHWQRTHLTESRLNILTEFWQNYLKNATPFLKLPLDYPRATQQHYYGDLIQVTLDSELTAQLKKLSQKENVTLFMLLLSSLQVLFYRYYGQTDILIGTPLANRNRLELESMMGFLINTLVIRTDLNGNPRFNVWLKQVRNRTLSAYTHQDMPFEKLIDMVQSVRQKNHSPLFQVLLVLHNTPSFSGGLFEFDHNDLAIMGNKYDLNWHFWDKESELVVKLYYNNELFKEKTIKIMLIHWQNLLKSIVTYPEQHIDQLNLLSENEHWQFNKNYFNFNQIKEESVIDAWQQQVNRTPKQSALHTLKVQWTYRDLLEHVRYCVAKLSTLNLPHESRIIILSGEDHEVITALLAGLWLGYVVVPLDHTQPLRRLTNLIQNAAANCLLYPSNVLFLAENLLQITDLKGFNLTECLKVNTLYCPEPRAKSNTLAYLLYTSGSTGEAKGILQNHRNALHFARIYRPDLGITDRYLFSSRYSVDNWVLDLIGALLQGATLYPYSLFDNGFNYLFDFIEKNKITVFHNTPTVFKQWLDSLPEKQCLPESLRFILLGGEPINSAIFLAYQQHATVHCQLINGYGLTEASSVLQQTLTLTDTFHTTFAPMGKIQDGMAVQLVNAEGQNTQIYGEILLISPYLAVGYWQNGAINAEKFPVDPKNPAFRQYRTGDLARLRSDGTLEYLGRSDFQLKSHGFRVEPEEIEQLLKSHPDIQNAIVQHYSVAASEEVENTIAPTQLVAYLILNTPPRIELKKELQNLLREHLPDYMRPHVFVQLLDIPLTHSGKINRHALPPPSQLSDLPSQHGIVTARTDLEQQLCEIWQTHLQKQPIGIYDNFFDLGGNSLLALRLLAAIERVLNVKQSLPLSLLFQAPTVAQLAVRLKQNTSTSLPALQVIQSGSGDNPLIFMGSIARARHLVTALPPEQTVYGFNIFAFEHRLSVNDCLYNVVQEYADELHKLGHANYSILGYCADSRIALALAHVLQQRGQQIDFLGFIDFGRWRRTRWRRHWENAHYFGFFNYGRHKLQHRFNFTYLFKQLHLKIYHYRQLYLKQNIQLPIEYQTLQFIGQFERLRNNWPLAPWTGKIHFFLSEEMWPEHTDEFSALAQQGVQLHLVSGFHLSLFTMPYLKDLANVVYTVLTHKK
jgi:amino acid adenylation domain-containing protein